LDSGTSSIANSSRSTAGFKPDRFALHLTLDEERVDGATVFPGQQTVLLAATTLLTLDGPSGRPLVEVAWSTPAIVDGSDITACVEVIDVMTGNISSDFECRTLFPQIPL
jgi:hypothetical protein